MRVLVCGGWDFADEAFLRETLDRLHATYGFTVLIEGDARGADRMAGAWADANGIEHVVYPAPRYPLSPLSAPGENGDNGYKSIESVPVSRRVSRGRDSRTRESRYGAEHGRHAALIRNEQMLRDGRLDLVLAFPGGGGTGHTCHLAEQMGVPVVRIAPPDA